MCFSIFLCRCTFQSFLLAYKYLSLLLLINTQSNVAFSGPVRCSQFYYMDRFILLVCGPYFYLYKYFLDMAAKSDLQR